MSVSSGPMMPRVPGFEQEKTERTENFLRSPFPLFAPVAALLARAGVLDWSCQTTAHNRGLAVWEPFDFERTARERQRSERMRKPPIRKLRRLPAENGCSSSTLSISSHVSRLWPFFFMTKVLTVAQGIQALPGRFGRLANPRKQCWKISPVMKKWSVKLETCRSSRAWLNSGAVLAINHQLFVCHSALASFWVVK